MNVPLPTSSWFLSLPALFVGLWGCTSPTNEAPALPVSGSTITGEVLDRTTSRPVAFARVSLRSGGSSKSALSDEAGRFSFTSITPASDYRLVVKREAYDTVNVEVPAAVGDTSALKVTILRKASIPSVKPLGRGIYRINARHLEEDYNGDGIYQRMTVKGAAFSPTSIGGTNVTSATIDRSMLYLDSLHANTIRTYSAPDPYLLNKAADHGLRVIASYWVDGGQSLADAAVREKIITDFRAMVNALKGYPAVLFWNIGNEQNYVLRPGEAPYWYDLVEELAIASFDIEGEYYHPVCASNGDFTNIGDPSQRASDSLLAYMDLWGSNIYYMNLTPSFALYRSRTAKPVVVTEFGIDALDNRTQLEYEAVQAASDSTNWTQIISAADVCVGGTVFEFTDEWWKAGNPSSHDSGGYATSQHPDGYSNEEWWGLIAVTPASGGEAQDHWRPRKVFRMFANVWQ